MLWLRQVFTIIIYAVTHKYHDGRGTVREIRERERGVKRTFSRQKIIPTTLHDIWSYIYYNIKLPSSRRPNKGREDNEPKKVYYAIN